MRSMRIGGLLSLLTFDGFGYAQAAPTNSNSAIGRDYDFIIVGAGPAGAALAFRLAESNRKPKVLLIDAGPTNQPLPHANETERFVAAADPNMNWGYKSTPQSYLNGHVLDLPRGKGLGGSTTVNFGAWTVGPKDDWNKFGFGWERVQRALQRIEKLNITIPAAKEVQDLLNPGGHETSGKVDLSYGNNQWASSVRSVFQAAKERGHRINPDINSGDPIGMGIGSVSYKNGLRETAGRAYLETTPPNLTILTDTTVSRVLFKNKKVVGVQTVSMSSRSPGEDYNAKEVILSAGAIGTPQILMLSGIGDSKELKKHNIAIVHESPMVGRNLREHPFSAVGVVLRKDIPDPPYIQTPNPMGFFKLSSEAFRRELQGLPKDIRNHLQAPRIPHFEIATHIPSILLGKDPSEFKEDEQFLGAVAILMNPQSTGSVRLSSANPLDKPIIDPNMLDRGIDALTLSHGLRETVRMLTAPIFASRLKSTIGPKADASDNEILEWIRKNVGTGGHLSGTARMGKDPKDSVINERFSVRGVEGLRVVDMSVLPELINSHTQSTAYVLGELAAEVLKDDHHL